MVTKDVLKNEIDKINEQYFPILYNIIKSFEISTISENVRKIKRKNNLQNWHQFIDSYSGCLADDPLERGNQGNFEIREKLT